MDTTWQALAESADAVCFGTLAQRSPQSRRTIGEFLKATRPETLRVFDLNLRQHFYSFEIITESLSRANVMKLNQEEVPRVRELLRVKSNFQFQRRALLLQGSNGEIQVAVDVHYSRSNGSLLCDQTSKHEHPGFRIQVKDTVGAGDAFTAALVREYLRAPRWPRSMIQPTGWAPG